MRGIQELNKATSVFDLQITEFSSAVSYLRYALVASKISSLHYKYINHC